MQVDASACVGIAFGMRLHCGRIDLPRFKINITDYQLLTTIFDIYLK